MKNPSLEPLKKAIASLREALNEPKTTFLRDATIQRFEYTVELAWKTAKRVMGTNSTAPRTVVREMAAAGLIQDPNLWFKYLDARNLTSHTYLEDIAEDVYVIAAHFLSDVDALFFKLEEQQ